MFKKISNNQQGFTIMELLIVIVVFGILTVVILRSIQDLHSQARDTERRVDIENLHAKLEAHWVSHRSYPASLGELSLIPGLSPEALIDPLANPIVVSSSESTNKPDSGYSNNQPVGAQYLYAGYDCSSTDTSGEEETETDEQTPATPEQQVCKHYVLYSWLEKPEIANQPAYEKTSLN